MYFVGGLSYNNGRADDPMPGTARSGHHARVNAQEVVVKVAHPPFRGDASPELSPDEKGQRRGALAVTAYPERGSNPHGATPRGILSPSAEDAGSVPTYPYRGETGSVGGPNSSVSIPNEDRQSPEASPDLLRHIRRRVTVSARGCWLWQGARNSKGYGQIGLWIAGRRRRVSRSVHRVVVELTKGPIPAGHMALHRCDVRHCVNPAHLYIGSASDNMRDLYERGQPNNVLASRNAAKDACPKGHPYSASNTRTLPDGSRTCRECRRQYDWRRRAAA